MDMLFNSTSKGTRTMTRTAANVTALYARLSRDEEHLTRYITRTAMKCSNNAQFADFVTCRLRTVDDTI